MKQNLYLCQYVDCQGALGIAHGLISDEQMSASSQWDTNHAANQGRLHFQAASGKGDSWTARRNDVRQWLQIDLGNQRTKVTGVATQGKHGQNQWVTKYRLQYGEDGDNFKFYKEQGQNDDKVRNDFFVKRIKIHSLVYLFQIKRDTG